MARDIHDGPIQELAAIIRRLERLPPTSADVDDLRTVTTHLREVVTNLHPPVLEYLGLGPAIRSLVELLCIVDIHVNVEIADQTDPKRGLRPPRAVELACYRIVEEALANGSTHSYAQTIEVGGRIDPAAVALTIRDDGVGIGHLRLKEDREHLGMSGMRERAALIGAYIRIRQSDRGGTEVSLDWPSP